jgi:hypothetical protein
MLNPAQSSFNSSRVSAPAMGEVEPSRATGYDFGPVTADHLNQVMEDSSNKMETFQSLINPIIDANRVIIFADHSHNSPLMHCTLALIEEHLLQDASKRIAICPEALFSGVPVAQNSSYRAKLYRQLAIKYPNLQFYGLESSQAEIRFNRLSLLESYTKSVIRTKDSHELRKCAAEIFVAVKETTDIKNPHSFENSDTELANGINSAADVFNLLSTEQAEDNLLELISIAGLYSTEMYFGNEFNRLDTNGDFAANIPIHDSTIDKIIVISGEAHCYETAESKSIQQHLENSNNRDEKIATILFNGGTQFAYGPIEDKQLSSINSVGEHLTFPGKLLMDTMKESHKMQEYTKMQSSDEQVPQPIFLLADATSNSQNQNCTLF